MKLALMRTATGKEDPELPLLQRIHSLHHTQTGRERAPSCTIVRKLILCPHTKSDHHTQAQISKQSLNQLYYFGDRSKSIKHFWQFSCHLQLLASLSLDINVELLFFLKCTRSSTPTFNPHIKTVNRIVSSHLSYFQAFSID